MFWFGSYKEHMSVTDVEQCSGLTLLGSYDEPRPGWGL